MASNLCSLGQRVPPGCFCGADPGALEWGKGTGERLQAQLQGGTVNGEGRAAGPSKLVSTCKGLRDRKAHWPASGLASGGGISVSPHSDRPNLTHRPGGGGSHLPAEN